MLNEKLKEIELILSEAAFMVSSGVAPKETHAVILRAMVMVSSLSGSGISSQTAAGSSGAEETEINKVQRRLKLWSNRPDQINHRILKAYLELEQNGLSEITETDLRNALGSEETFDSNFNQMKNISEKNHGKVFEQIGELVRIWPPVEPYVRNFRATLKDRGEI
jgi:hypothetical protein